MTNPLSVARRLGITEQQIKVSQKLGLTDEQIQKVAIETERRWALLEANPQYHPRNIFPNVLSHPWRELEYAQDARLYSNQITGLKVICSCSQEVDGHWWMHVSGSHRDRQPSYKELREIKDMFVGKQRKAIQVFPKEEEYVNLAKFVLHLWSCLDHDPFPDFTAGTGSL